MSRSVAAQRKVIFVGSVIRVAEAEKIEVSDEDVDAELEKLAQRERQTARARPRDDLHRLNGIATELEEVVVDTDALKFFPNREQLLAEYGRRTPLGPTLTPRIRSRSRRSSPG